MEHFEGSLNINRHIPTPALLTRAFAVQVVEKNPKQMKMEPSPREETGKQGRQRHLMARPATEGIKWPTNTNEILCSYTQLVQKASHW